MAIRTLGRIQLEGIEPRAFSPDLQFCVTLEPGNELVLWRLRDGGQNGIRATKLIGMLLGMPVSAGFVDKASARLDARLQDAGFDGAMQAAQAAEPALGADETPVNVLAPDTDPGTG